MQYIQLSNSYIINTLQGTYTLTKESFHFNKIKRLLAKNVSENEILPLLKSPKLSNGVYKAYLILDTKEMYYVHIQNTDIEIIQEFNMLNGTDFKEITDKQITEFMGIYTSKEELISDWPEYLI